MSSSSTCASSIELVFPVASIFTRSFGQKKMDCWVSCDKNYTGFKLRPRGDNHNLHMTASVGEYRSIALSSGNSKKKKPLLRVLRGDEKSNHWRLCYRCPTCPQHNTFYTDFVTAFNYGGTEAEFTMDLRPADRWCRCRASEGGSAPRSKRGDKRLVVRINDEEHSPYFFKVVDETGKVCLKAVRSSATTDAGDDTIGLTFKEPFNVAAAFGLTIAVATAWKERQPSKNFMKRLTRECSTRAEEILEKLLRIARRSITCGTAKKEDSK